MNVDEIKKICVVGAGNMGRQIALACALAGYDTACSDHSDEQLLRAEEFKEKYLGERVARGKLSAAEAAAAGKRLTFGASLEEAADGADFVIEAAVEKLAVKRSLFAQLDQICPPHAILATNSSYIVSSRIADATGRPEKVCNMHFFNPALVMKCVEVVQGPHTAAETAQAAMALARRLNKIPVLLRKEIYGFLVNRIFRRIQDEALFLLDTGVASAEDIDKAVVNALGHPMGPFQLMDLTGIDLNYHSRMELYAETMDPAHRPSPEVVARYVRKEWGRKSGKGFYEYDGT